MAFLNHEQLGKMWTALTVRIGTLNIPSSAANSLDPIYNLVDAWGVRYTDAIKTGGRALSSAESTTWQNALREQTLAVDRLAAKYPPATSPAPARRAATILPAVDVTGDLPWYYWPLRVGAGIGAGYIAYKVLRSFDPDPNNPMQRQARAFAGIVPPKKLKGKKLDALINNLYAKHGNRVQINIMDLGKIHAAGVRGYEFGGEEEADRAVAQAIEHFRRN